MTHHCPECKTTCAEVGRLREETDRWKHYSQQIRGAHKNLIVHFASKNDEVLDVIGKLVDEWEPTPEYAEKAYDMLVHARWSGFISCGTEAKP